MKLFLSGHGFRYAMEQIQLSLFPQQPLQICTEPPAPEEDGAVSALFSQRGTLVCRTVITLQGQTGRAECALTDGEVDEAQVRMLLRRCYYQAALPLLPRVPVWGALSGVRPSKLTTRHLLAGGTEQSADALLRDVYSVAADRRELCLQASRATMQAIGLSREKDLSVYVGIPFCPTRCAYCSFVSASVQRFSGLLEPFLQQLLDEISYTGMLLRQSGWHVRTLYIGGGTPTTLSSGQLERLMQALDRAFDLTDLLEYTVEGGRPDTLSAEKLQVLRQGGATRVSINPQTMSDEILQRVGRRHTAAEVIESFRQAREAGFEQINMDLIAGLPGDSPQCFAGSLCQVMRLNPENITVHTLALKKGADLYAQRKSLPTDEDVQTMLSEAQAALRGGGYVPYYLYRQKYMSGSFENVGWTRPGGICWYNIYMMEELHPVLALGGGGVTKLVDAATGRIRRFSNPKYPTEYLNRPQEIRERKQAFFSALEKL